MYESQNIVDSSPMDTTMFDNMPLRELAGFWFDMAEESSDSKEAALFATVARIAMELEALTKAPGADVEGNGNG